MKRILSLALSAVMIATSIPFAYATNNYDQGTKVEYTATNNENYTITVPALLQPGQSGNVNLEGSWAENRVITVTADKTVTLTNSIKSSDTKVLDIYFEGISEKGNNTKTQTFTEPISVKSINNALFGTWSGRFNYNVIPSDIATKAEISVQATDKNGNDLNAKSYVINDNEKDQLLLELKNSNLINNTEEVDALIEVKSDDFDDLADTTFDVSSIAQPGDKVVILHYNEETREWEYISEETVSAEGKVNADFSSYSPIAFVVVKQDGTIAPIGCPAYYPYEEGNYRYMPLYNNSGWGPSLELARDFYKMMTEEETGMSWEEVLIMANISEEEAFASVELTEDTFVPSTELLGWQVELNLKKTDKLQKSYGPILENVYGYPITSLRLLFFECFNLEEAPEIPSTVTDMTWTFLDCQALTEAPAIPDGVTSLNYTFMRTAITVAPKLPSALVDFAGTFQECPIITYEGSAASDGDFSGYVIPDGVTTMEDVFWGCDEMVIAPKLPSDLQNADSIWGTCEKLTTVFSIPEHVTKMRDTFNDCPNLQGTIEINANPEIYEYCFFQTDMSKITLTGTSNMLNEIGATGSNYQAK